MKLEATQSAVSTPQNTRLGLGDIAYTHSFAQAIRGVVTKSARDGVVLDCVERITRDGTLERLPGKFFARSAETFPDLEGVITSATFRRNFSTLWVVIDALTGRGSEASLPKLPEGEMVIANKL